MEKIEKIKKLKINVKKHFFLSQDKDCILKCIRKGKTAVGIAMILFIVKHGSLCMCVNIIVSIFILCAKLFQLTLVCLLLFMMSMKKNVFGAEQQILK